MKFFTTTKISENIRETPEGFLVCLDVSIARTGEMIYGAGECPIPPGPDGKVVVLRNADEVFRPETIASFQGKALTILHPEDWVNPKTWVALANGVVQNVRRGVGAQDNDLVADLLVTTDRAIELIKNGLREVSCGYEADWLETGVGRGIQKNIIGNHLALVAEGRAGAAYAINDHKGKGTNMKMSEKIKAIFARAADEACKEAEGDAAAPAVEVAKPSSGYDELVSMMKDMSSKLEAMGPKKDAAAPEVVAEKKEEAPAKDEPAAAAPSLEDRLKKVEDALSQLLSGKDAEKKDDDKEEAKDAGEEEEAEEVEDDAEEEAEMVGDSASDNDEASRIEILAPGLKAKGKDAKVQALTAAYKSKDGKAIIDRFTGGNEPDYKNENLVNTLFVGASELLKVKRNSDLAKTRVVDAFPEGAKSGKSAEEINKANEKFYSAK